MKVAEIFHSIQGEGPNSGIPTTFIRFAGCNLRCLWCDTKLSYNNGKEMDLYQIRAATGSRNRICLTGGEPTLQDEAEMKNLLRLLNPVYVELFTNGSQQAPSWVSLVDTIVVDVKGPSSGMQGKTLLSYWGWNEMYFKFVVADELDLLWAKREIRDNALRPDKVFISPVGGCPEGWVRRIWEFCVEGGYRFQVQLHKVVFGNKRGV